VSQRFGLAHRAARGQRRLLGCGRSGAFARIGGMTAGPRFVRSSVAGSDVPRSIVRQRVKPERRCCRIQRLSGGPSLSVAFLFRLLVDLAVYFVSDLDEPLKTGTPSMSNLGPVRFFRGDAVAAPKVTRNALDANGSARHHASHVSCADGPGDRGLVRQIFTITE
jgi:hypothetical protein